jgi:hypothetical protein
LSIETMCKTTLPTFLAILLISNLAMADVVRRSSLPDSYSGDWIATESNQTVVGLSAKTYADNDANCVVNWVSETPAASGSIYSAHMQCSRRSDPAGKNFPLNLIIWPRSSDEIAIGPAFTSLKIFHRCRAAGGPPTGVARSRAAPLNATETGGQGECPQ